MEPRIRTVNKAVAPFPLNRFPRGFIEKFGEDIAYLGATKDVMTLEGNDWEQIFANCIGAEWHPSNVGLDDVVLNNCCWGAKTVYGSGSLANQQVVRLICGRNSPIYSFGEGQITTQADPNHIGKLVLDIWNERVSGVRQIFKFVRTVVLVKSKDFSDFLIFETDTLRYDPEEYFFVWNQRGNLEGYSKRDELHRFTWQPHGSQFTIIEPIPENRLHLQVRRPPKLDKQSVLESIGYSNEWIHIVGD